MLHWIGLRPEARALHFGRVKLAVQRDSPSMLCRYVQRTLGLAQPLA